VYNM